MSGIEQFSPIVEEIEYLLAERSQLAEKGPRFIVIHGHHQPGTLCLPGETIEHVSLSFREREFDLSLSPRGLLIFDSLCRYRRAPLSASRIRHILLTDPFYRNHGSVASGRKEKLARPSQTSVKVYIYRIREQLAKVFTEAGLPLDPNRVLLSEATDSNVVVYRIKATVEFAHSAR